MLLHLVVMLVVASQDFSSAVDLIALKARSCGPEAAYAVLPWILVLLGVMANGRWWW